MELYYNNSSTDFIPIPCFPVSCSYQTLTTHSLRKTPNALAKGQELWCYSCDSMEEGEQCLDLTGNHSNLMTKCKPEEFYCTVKRISYTITTENATTPLRTWSLQRQCSSSCGKGCIVIGERTKLFACTSCCETNLCNVGEGKGVLAADGRTWVVVLAQLICLWRLYGMMGIES